MDKTIDKIDIIYGGYILVTAKINILKFGFN